MDSNTEVRQSEQGASQRTLRVRLPAIALFTASLAAAAVVLFELATQPTKHAAHPTPAFLTSALGAPQPSAPLARVPSRGVEIAIDGAGFALDTPAGGIALQSDDARGGAWTPHRHGAARPTDHGSQAVVIDGNTAEEFQTIASRQGVKTWRWKLDTELEPRGSGNGYVGFFSGSELVPLEIKPVKIFDRKGRNVTPAGLQWGIDRRGDNWWLTLRLDDGKLPLPYTIDPAGSYRTDASAVTWTGTGTATIAIPATVQANDLLVIEQTARVGSTAYPTAPTDAGGGNTWTKLTAVQATISQVISHKYAIATDAGINVTVTPSSAAVAGTINLASLHVYKGVTGAIRHAQVSGTATIQTMGCAGITPTGASAGAPSHLMCFFSANAVPTTAYTGALGMAPWAHDADTGATAAISNTAWDAEVTAATAIPAILSSNNIFSAATAVVGASMGWATDVTAPTVTDVSSTNADGSYAAGQVIHVTITFSEPVVVTGTPTLTLNTAPSRTAGYVSGSGTTALTFDYTVQAGDTSADLDYPATSSLALAGGTIRDNAANNATLTLPAVGGASSLGGQKNIVVDTTAPTVTNVSSTTANGAYRSGQSVAVTITFSENVTVTGTPTLALNSVGSASYSSGSGTSTLTFNYTIGAGENATDLDYSATSSLALAGGTIEDAATNNATLTLPAVGGASSLGGQKNIVVDTDNPTATATTPPSNGTRYNAAGLPASFGGSSADTGGSSTVSTVQIAIQTGSGNYWGGATFNQASIFYNATGGTPAAWTYSTATLAGQLVNGTTYTITARSTDSAGNTGTTTRTFVYDTTAPTVSSVSSTSADGSYTTGVVIPVTITFGEAVNVTGTPQLTLNTAPSRTINYVSGSGTATLTFNYTVQAGDTSADLDYAATTSLTLNGGTISDDATNNATLTLPAVGGASSLGGQKNIVVDTTAPTVTSVSSTKADGAYPAGTSIPITVTFGENVTVTGSPTLALNSGGTATYSSGSGGATLTFAYATAGGENTGDLDYSATSSLALAGGTIKDAATNVATLTLPTVGGASSIGGQKAIVVDTNNPTASVATPALDGTRYNAASLPANLAGSSADTGGSSTVSTVQVAIQDGGGNYWGGATFNQGSIAYVGTGGTVGAWTYSTATLAGQLTDSHTYTITARSTDAAGNSGTSTRTFVYDTSAPTVTSVSSSTADGAYRAGQAVTITMAFSENVTVTGTPTLALNSGGSASYSGGSGGPTLSFTYNIAGSENAADLDYSATNSLALAGGTIKDAATNNATLTLPAVGGANSIAGQKAIVIDTSNPTASVTTPASDGLTYNAASLPGNLAGGTADTGGSSTVSAVSVAIQDGAGNYWGGATFNQGSIFYNAASGTTSWTYSTGALAGQLTDGHTYTITARSTDAAGNTGTATRTFVHDTTAPTVTNVTASNANGVYTSGATIHVQITFSETVTVTGTPKINLNAGHTADYVSGSGTSTLTFDYAIQAGDNVATLEYNATNSLFLNGGTIKDAATNNATLTLPVPGAAGSLSGNKNIRIDTTTPSVISVSASNANGAYKAGDTIHVQVTFSENVDVTGTPKLTLNTSPSRTADYVSGTGGFTLTFDYTVQAGDTSADLDYAATSSLALNGGTITDAATNNATLTLPAVGGASSLGGQKNIVIDTTNPTASVTTPAGNGTVYNAASMPANLAGSSADAGGSGVSTVQVAIQDGGGNYWGGAAFNQGSIFYNAVSGATSWTYSTGTLAGQLTDSHTYTITAKATDAAGNTLTTTRTFVVDTTPPTSSSATVGADGVTVTITWSETLDQTQAVPGSAYSIAANGGGGVAGTAAAVSYPAANQTRFMLSSAVHHLDSLALTYTRPGSDPMVRDTALTTGNAAVTATLNNASIANNTANLAPATPTLVSPADGAHPNTSTPTLTATFGDSDSQDTGKVTFEICSDSGCSSSLGTFDSTNTNLAVGANGSAAVPGGFALASGSTYYWRAKDVDSSAASSSFSATRSFLVDTTAPTISSVAVAADGVTVTITWSENLDQTQTVPGSAFAVAPNGSAGIAGTATAVAYTGANQTELTLASTLHHLDSLVLTYTAPGGNPKVRDTATPAGNAAATASGLAVTNNTSNVAPSTPTPVSPADGARLNTTTPTLTATFGDPDSLDTGKVTFEVCSMSNCSSSLGTFDSSSTNLAVGANGSAAVPGGFALADGATYYWRAKNVDSSAASSSFSTIQSFLLDTTAPTISTATVAADGVTVTVTWSENLDQTLAVPGSAFSVAANGGAGIAGTAAAVSYPAANQTRFTLASTVHHLDTLALDYTAPGGDPKVRDAAAPTGNAAASTTGLAVTNNTADVAPSTPALVSPADGARLNTSTPTLTATFADSDSQDTGKVTFEVCATSNCSSSLGTFDSTATNLAVGANGSAAVPGGFALASGTTYYWRAKNVDSSAASSSFSATQSFLVDTTAPTMSTATVAADGVTVTVTWSENLDQTMAVPGTAFSVPPNGGAGIAGTAAAVSYPAANQTRFTLSSTVHHLDTLTLDYTKPGSNPMVRDLAFPTGNAAVTASGLAVTNNTSNVAPSTPALVSPADAAHLNTSTPTLTATFGDADSQDTGKVTFEVCSTSNCSSSLGTFDSSSTNLGVGTNGAAAVPGGFALADGATYYWRAQNVDSSAASSSFSAIRSFLVDRTAPTISSAAVAADGVTVTVTWSENLDQLQNLPGSAFSVSPNAGAGIAGTAAAVSYPAANQTRFTLSSTVHHLDSLALDYTKPGSNPMVRDTALSTGNAAATASGLAVTNNTANVAPSTPSLVTPADGYRVNTATPALTATFVDPDPNDTGTLTFQVCANATCTAGGDAISTFSTPAGIANNTNGTASVPGAASLSDSTYYWRAKGTDSSSGQSTYGTSRSFIVDTTAPTIGSASVAADGTTVTVTWSESLDQLQNLPGSAFSVSPNGGAGIAGTAAAVTYPAANQTRFTLATAVHFADALTLDYTQPGAGARVRDNALSTGNAATTANGTAITNGTADLDPATPPLVAPANAAVVSTTTPALTATFSDPDPNDSGKVTFEVCSDSGCSSSLGTFQSGTVANGANGSASVPGGLSLQNGTTYYWRAKNVDSVAASSSFSATRSLSVDVTSPAVAVTAPTALTGTGFQYYDLAATTLWLNAGQTGTFKLNATATDAQSGISSVDFPALFGTGSNAGTGGPSYASATYTFDGTGTPFGSPGSKTITASNGVTVPAPLTGTAQVTISADNAAPAAFGLGGPADSTKVRGANLLVSASPRDADSGLRQVDFFQCDRTVTPLCSPSTAIGAAQTVPTLGVYSVTLDTTGLTDGHDYALAAVATDNVGHTTNSSINTIRVDNSAPNVTVAPPMPVTGGQYQWYDSGSKKLWLNANQSGSFKLHANADDPHSGISSVTFPDLFGSGANGGTPIGGGVYESTTYAFASPAAPGVQSISAANGVTLPSAATGSDSLTIGVDAVAPATNPTFPLNNGSYDNTTWNPGCTTPGICGTVTDGGSGTASVKLSIKDSTTGKYYDGAGFTQGTQAPFLTAALAGTNWSYAIDDTKLTSPHVYVVDVFATDYVANGETHQQLRFTYGSDTGAPATTLTVSSASHAFLFPLGAGDYDLYYSTASGGGSFTLDASATDASGVDTVKFPDLTGTSGFGGSGGTSTNGGNADPFTTSRSYSFTGSAATPPGPKTVTSVDLRSNSGDNRLTFLLDNAAPTGGGLSVNGSVATGAGSSAFVTTTTLSIGTRTDYAADGAGSGVASSVLTVESAALSAGACGSYGSPTTVTGTDLSSIAFANGNCYRFTLTGTDRVGNVATLTTALMVDTTAPNQPSVAFSGLSSGNTYDDGAGTLFYRPSAGGTFTVNANGSTDAESAVKTGNAGYAFSALTGFVAASQAGNKVDVTFTGASTGGGAYTVHSTNNAGLDSTDAGYNVTLDATAPVNGALTVNSTSATGVGTSSYLTTGSSVAIDSRTDYTDAASGIASSTLTVQSATLANDACGSFGSPTTITGTSNGVGNGNCYLFTLTGTDHVGNSASISTIVKVDTTAPIAPTVSLSGLSAGNTYVNGTTLYYRPSAGGTFTVNANGASDPETGIKAGNAGYTFSTLSGFLSALQTGNKVDVTFDGTSAGGGAQSVVAVNNAGVSSTPATALTVTADAAVPAGGLLSINPYSGSLTVSIATTPFTDALSGIAGNAVTRSDPQVPNGSGGCPNAGYTGAAVVPGASDTVPTDGQCYEYTLTGTDNVANVATYRTIVLVDTTGPAGGSVSYVDGLASLNSISVGWGPGTDAQSGIGVVNVERASATLTGLTCGSFGSFTVLVANAAGSPVVDSTVAAGNCYVYRIVVANNAGVSSTFGSASVAQLTSASPIQLAPGAPSGTYLSGATLWLGPAAANQAFSLQLTALGKNGVTSATWQGKAGALQSTPTIDTTTGTDPFVSAPYTWNGTALTDSVQLTRNPGATVDSLGVRSDLTDPTGTIGYTDGNYSSHSVAISTSAGDTGGSGVAGIQVLRAETTLTGSTCDTTAPSWSSFAPVTLGAGSDTTVTDNHCYRYQLLVSDNVGNQYTAASANVAMIPDVTPPTFLTAATNVAGTQLTVTMSEPLDATATTPAAAFTIAYNGVVQPTPTGIGVSGSTVMLNLVSPPNNSQTVTVRYSQPGSSGDRMRDDASPTKNESANFGPAAVVNNTPDTVAPSVVSTSVNAGTLTITFTENLAGAAPDATAFTVTTGSTTRSISAVGMSGKIVTLTISPAVTSSDNVVAAYAVPALNALHDAAANNTTPFTIGAANETPIIVPPAGGAGPSAPAPAPALVPALVSESPDDGSTVRAVSSITLNANQSVTWKAMTVTAPDGSVTPLRDDAGQSATWPFSPSAEGLYVVRGTLAGGGSTVDVLSHFTVWTMPATQSGATVPPVAKNAVPFAAGELKSSDGLTLLSWPAGAFSDLVVVEIAPKPAGSVRSLPANSIVVDVTAFLRSTHAPVTELGGVVDVRFANATPGAHAVTSPNGSTWRDIPQLPTLNLPADQSDGWFRDSDGTIHVLARHLSLYALVGQEVSTKLAMRIITVRRLWLEHRSFIAVRMALTAPARVTGSFIGPDGSIVPGQTVETPTRHAGVTLLRVPLRVTKPGIYKLQMHAEGAGQTVNRTARIRFVAKRPASPVWTDLRPLRVALVRGVKGMDSLDKTLGRGFVLRRIADAALYDVVDTRFSTAAVAVVVDLDAVPTYTLASLHALLPEVTIIGLSNKPARAAYYRSIGIGTVLSRSASPAAVSSAIKRSLRGR